MVLKKLAEANPSMNLDIGDFCATLSSEDDENGTPFTVGTVSGLPGLPLSLFL